MKKFSISFDIDRVWSNVIIQAESEEEAERKFNKLTIGDLLDMCGEIPEAEIDEVFELKDEEVL
jgi:hypothetical protein